MCRLVVAVKNPALFRASMILSTREGNTHGTGLCRFHDTENSVWYVKSGKDASTELFGGNHLNFDSDLLWGHTRMASASYRVAANFINSEDAHPHVYPGVTVMHNGMFKDYLSVRRENGLTAATDSGVFAELLAKNSSKVDLPDIVTTLHQMGAAEYSLLVSVSWSKTLFIIRGNRHLYLARFEDGSKLINTAQENIYDTITIASGFGEVPDFKIELLPEFTAYRIQNDTLDILEQTDISEVKIVAEPPKPVVTPATDIQRAWTGYTYPDVFAKESASPATVRQMKVCLEKAQNIVELRELFPEISLEELEILAEMSFNSNLYDTITVNNSFKDMVDTLEMLRDAVSNLEDKLALWEGFCDTVTNPIKTVVELYPNYEVPIWLNDPEFFAWLEEYNAKIDRAENDQESP